MPQGVCSSLWKNYISYTNWSHSQEVLRDGCFSQLAWQVWRYSQSLGRTYVHITHAVSVCSDSSEERHQYCETSAFKLLSFPSLTTWEREVVSAAPKNELLIKLTSEMLDEGTVVGVSPPVMLCHYTHDYSISISTACRSLFLTLFLVTKLWISVGDSRLRSWCGALTGMINDIPSSSQ